MPDTLYADVSEWQRPVDDSYPHPVLCIRSNDGTYLDRNWHPNYSWCKGRCETGALVFFIVYFVWRPNWADAVETLKLQVGRPHPKMAVMLDVESWGGQITGDQSAGINAAFEQVAAWLGDRRRVIGYGNQGDLDTLWPVRPPDTRLVVAKYSTTPPDYPGQIAHQYTDGAGYGSGPQASPPFGHCDHNYAYGLTAHEFAAELGCAGGLEAIPQEQWDLLVCDVRDIREQLRGPYDQGWPQLGCNEAGQHLSVVDALASVKVTVEHTDHIHTQLATKPIGDLLDRVRPQEP